MRVSTADFIKNYGTLADKALAEPVTITKNGRDRLVVISVEEYDRLKRRDRRVVKLEDFADEDMALIAKPEAAPRRRASRRRAERLASMTWGPERGHRLHQGSP